jgi:outer membrane protein
MRPIQFLIVGLSLLFSPVLEAAEDHCLSFQEGLTLALEQGADVQRARLNAVSAEASSRSTAQAWQPDFSFGASSSTGIDMEGTNASANASLQSSMALWHGGELRDQRREAEASTRSARLSIEQTRQGIVWNLVSAWITLDQATARLSVAQSSLEVETTTLDRVQAMVDAGSHTRADAAAQQAAVAEATASVAQAEGDIALAELSLVQLLRLEPTETWQFQPLENRPAAQTNEARALLDQALRSRPDLSALVADAEAAEASVDAARSGRLPSLDLEAALSTGWNSATEGTFPSQIGDGAGASITLQLQVPLWDRGVTRSAVDQATASREMADLSLDEARREVVTDILGVLEQQRTARAVVDATAVRLAASEEAETWTRQRFEAGAASLVELAQARSTLEDARQAEVKARYDLISLQWELAWVTGSVETP